jgi:hypothetical protein
VLHELITTLILTTTIGFAAPPEIECLSGLSVTEAFEQRKNRRPKNIIFLVSDRGFPAESWESSIWNDPEFVEHLKKSGIMVAYMDRETDPVLFEVLKIESLPTFVFYHDSILTRRRSLLHTTDEVRDSYIEWVDAAKRGTTRSRIMQEELESEPSNIELRFELMKEFHNEGRDADGMKCLYWLFEHNEMYFQYVKRLAIEEQEELENPEMSFRAMLMWFINGPRDNLGLYIKHRSRVDNSPPRDGWAEAIKLVDDNRINTEHDRKIEVMVNLRRTLELKRENNTATDRDLFILKALTAEGDEARALAEEYKPYFK